MQGRRFENALPLAAGTSAYLRLVPSESENGSAEIRVGRRPEMAPMTVRMIMMNEPKRARRIRDLERMKAKCRRVYPRDTKAKQANHLAVCSGYCCGNLRRF